MKRASQRNFINIALYLKDRAFLTCFKVQFNVISNNVFMQCLRKFTKTSDAEFGTGFVSEKHAHS